MQSYQCLLLHFMKYSFINTPDLDDIHTAKAYLSAGITFSEAWKHINHAGQ